MECAWGIIYAFDNFGWAVEYILQSINDCKVEGNVDVLCAEAIGDIVFSGRDRFFQGIVFDFRVYFFGGLGGFSRQRQSPSQQYLRLRLS